MLTTMKISFLVDITEIRYKLARRFFKTVKQHVYYKHPVLVFIVSAFYLTLAEVQ